MNLRVYFGCLSFQNNLEPSHTGYNSRKSPSRSNLNACKRSAPVMQFQSLYSPKRRSSFTTCEKLWHHLVTLFLVPLPTTGLDVPNRSVKNQPYVEKTKIVYISCFSPNDRLPASEGSYENLKYTSFLIYRRWRCSKLEQKRHKNRERQRKKKWNLWPIS